MMEKSVKKILSVIIGINGYLFSNFLQADTDLSAQEQAAIQEMSESLKATMMPSGKGTMHELLDANVRGDSKEPGKFRSNIKIELSKVKFDTSRLLATMKKWEQIKIILQANTEDKNIKWAENCTVNLYVGYDKCRPDGKMLLFKSDCTCALLPTNTEQSILFFIPGDVRQRYELNHVPNYCAIQFSVDGINQNIIIIDKEGKNAYQANPLEFHKKALQRSSIETRIMRNVDQLPIYADIRISNHPTLLLEIDA